MALISLQNINIAFGGSKILEDINLLIEKQQRVCLLGRNGVGKSTLMKIISGTILPDSGELQKDSATRISYFSQDIPEDLEGTVFSIIASGLGKRGEILLEYHRKESVPGSNETEKNEILNELHNLMEQFNVWSAYEEISTICSRMEIEQDWIYRSLSGGQKRRALLAAALVSQPDLLLLDEPTNHLDIDSISWLEDYLLKFGVTILFVTHDRMLLKRLATRIIELDRGKLVDWSCEYDTFLQRKQAVLDSEEKEWENFDKKLAQEEIWIRKGIRARRTRNEGRVRALIKMRNERAQRRERQGSVNMALTEAERSGKLVLEAKDISFAFDEQVIVKDFNLLVARGDKIGIIGPNGCGKTTLVKILLQQISLQNGTVHHGTNISVAYFDQLRGQLDPEKSVWENVLPNGNMVDVNGKPRHIISYLQDFLFTPERSKSPVSQLSGGERNRLLLARLFTQPANFLVFDEPTNDLDFETLELLEELLVEFNGTVIIISHDRAFINNVVSSTLVFECKGFVKEYIGGYDDWQLAKQKQQESVIPEKSIDKGKKYSEERKAKQKVKRTFKEEQELKELPAEIDTFENEQQEIHDKMADPEIYKDKNLVIELKSRLEIVEEQLEKLYQRWEELEAIGA